MNIFKWSWVIPVLFKQITKFLVRIMSLLRYNADQFWFLKIKSLQITLTHGNFPVLLHLTWRERVGFPSASATSWCELGARGGVCPPFSDITLGLRGPRSELEALETLVQLSRAHFFAGQQNQKPDVAMWPLEMGLLAAINRHPYCLVTRVREAAHSGVGVQTPGWDFTVLPAGLPPDLHLIERKEEGAAGKGPVSQHSAFPVSALGDYALKHPISNQRETSSDKANPCFLCLWLYTHHC